MRSQRKQRLTFIIVIAMSLSVVIALVLYALRQNINLFFTPSQVWAGEAPKQHLFRIGGLVKPSSVHYASTGLNVTFVITDNAHDVKVEYNGVLPDLFREGQGIVVLGKLNSQGNYIASQVLAKHDESYMPSEVHIALQNANPKLHPHKRAQL